MSTGAFKKRLLLNVTRLRPDSSFATTLLAQSFTQISRPWRANEFLTRSTQVLTNLPVFRLSWNLSYFIVCASLEDYTNRISINWPLCTTFPSSRKKQCPSGLVLGVSAGWPSVFINLGHGVPTNCQRVRTKYPSSHWNEIFWFTSRQVMRLTTFWNWEVTLTHCLDFCVFNCGLYLLLYTACVAFSTLAQWVKSIEALTLRTLKLVEGYLHRYECPVSNLFYTRPPS